MRRRPHVIAAGVTLILSLSPVLGGLPGGRGAGHAAAGPIIHLEPVLSNLSSPIYVTSARDTTDRLFVVEQGGVIKVVQPGSTTATVFLDISDKVTASGEQGLLGLAFHPLFSSNRRFFVDYTRKGDGATVIAEYQASLADPDVADTTETPPLLVIPQPFSNHNGGMLDFGHDGFLYIAMGDGGSGDDPGNRAQDVNELLGKILRIDVDYPNGTVPYSSPPTNPFFGATSGRDEIFAYGLRNPWRFSFDRLTGDLYAGDVGQGAREEIDLVTLGGNYGWRVREGMICSGNDALLCDLPGFISPLTDYSHTNGRCAVTGGYVYRGTEGSLPAGTYVFADFCSGEIFQLEGGGASLLLSTGLLVSSFGEDEAGEIYVVDLTGTVHRIAAGPAPCAVSLGSTGRSFSAKASRSGTVTVKTTATCGWSATSNAPWLAVTSGAQGTGNGTVRYSLAANTSSPSPRTGTLTIGGNTFTVTQAGSPLVCRASISPLRQTVSSTGGTGTVSVEVPAGCSWTAVSHAGWITITSGASGTGNGTVSFTVAPGTGRRTGTITVAGRAIRISSF